MTLPDIKRSTSAKPAPSPISLLQRMAPPQAIIHIGAGAGNGEMHQWRQWDVPNVLIIDADADRLDWASPLIVNKPDWRILTAVLAETESELEYHQATNPEEDGIIAPEHLNALWPNLRATAQGLRPARRLDHILMAAGGALEQAIPTWVFVDCLPALSILKGAGAHIDRWSVIWLRVLLRPIADIDEGAALESVEAFLQGQGFRCVDVTESNHPAIGHALFARNWHAVLQPRIETLAQTTATLTKEKSGLEERRDELQGELATLAQTRDELSKLVAESHSRIEELTQERDSHAQATRERNAHIDNLNRTNATLTEEKLTLTAHHEAQQAEVASLAEARDEQSKLATQREAELKKLQTQLQQQTARITQFEAELPERDARQRLLNDEMTRAEAQIDLIKDLLLREPGL